jgi:hypothetical protein
MSYSVREIAAQMDPLVGQVSPLSLRSILGWQRFSENDTAARLSCRELVRRHMPEQSIPIRFLSYNTYLLEAYDIKMPDPFGDIRIGGKPEIDNRAKEIGQKISTEEYDFVSLYEIMQERERSAIFSSLSFSPKGNVYGGDLTSLLTISRSFNVTRNAKKLFSHSGKPYRINPTLLDVIPNLLGAVGIGSPEFDVSLDSDFYAHKGVLLTEIDTGLRTANNEPILIEVYSTHLMFGGGLGKTAETIANIATPFGAHMSPSNDQERFAIQIQQVDELVEFYHQKHHPQNVAILCGDFNLDGTNAQQYAVLKSRLSAIGMTDTWAEGPLANPGSGQTARNDDGDGRPHEADFSNVCFPSSNPNAVDYCDETQTVPSPSYYVGRLDYIFIEAPTTEHLCNVDFARVRRRQFRRQRPTPNQQFLSDHLGLETTFFVSLKV